MGTTLAIIIEATGSSVIVAGIVLEAITGAGLGYIVISAGCLLTTVWGLIFSKIVKRPAQTGAGKRER